MGVLFSNNAATTLASGCTNVATSLSVVDASEFPSVGGADYCYLTLASASGADIEIIKCTAISGTTLTVVRGQDSTSGTAFITGDRVELRVVNIGLTDALAERQPLDSVLTNTTASFTTADETKLDGIEALATVDQTDAEIRTAVEAATDSNVFTDADHTKLNAIEALADVTDVTNVTAAGALMDSEIANLADVKAFAFGSTVQAYDADTTKNDVNNTFTKSQRGSITALTSTAASIAVDLANNNHFSHTFTENTTLANPSNIVAGQCGSFLLTQHASAPKTLAFGSYYKFPSGTAPTITATNSAEDRIDYIVRSTIKIECVWTGASS